MGVSRKRRGQLTWTFGGSTGATFAGPWDQRGQHQRPNPVASERAGPMIQCLQWDTDWARTGSWATLFTTFFVVLGFELRALSLLCRRSTAWATPPALWALFFKWSLTLCLGWSRPQFSHLRHLHNWDDRHPLPWPAYWLTRGLTNLCLGWSRTPVFPISASQVTGVTGRSHHALDHALMNLIFKHHPMRWMLSPFDSKGNRGTERLKDLPS
jgi:hypothetical protein